MKNNKFKTTDFSFPFFRIGTGLLCMLNILMLKDDIYLFYSNNPLLPNDLMALDAKSFIMTLPEIIDFINQLGWEQFGFSHFLTFFLIISLCLILGIQSRIAAVLCLVSQVAIVKSAALFSYGFDYFLSMSLLYCIVFPVGRYFSIDSYFSNKEQKTQSYMWVLQIHLCIAYFFSGLCKGLGYNWWNGESIWKSIHLPYVNTDMNLSFDWLAHYPFILTVMGISVVLLELLYPVFMSIRSTKELWLAATLVMHVGIAAVLNLYLFSAIMMMWNITAFYLNDGNFLFNQSK